MRGGKGYAVGGALHLHLFDSLVYPSFEILSIPRSNRFAMFFVPGSEKNGFPDPGASFLQLGELNVFLYFIFIYACTPFQPRSFPYLSIYLSNQFNKIKLDRKCHQLSS